ncbi:hypothetical protein DQX05_06555 [Paenibacillus thiaminolyticus]|uniref:Uncharacterized protein n=1 Tax=Paenibacillus thiaminolyticus TaxID=49283 RepID=A0A3A3GKT6_PANTH|nr:hypothetical protein DQX05_06555 [Paenibacillus thiaminolyticus]
MNTSGYKLNLPISKVHQVYHPFWKNQDRYLAFLMAAAVDKHLNSPLKNEVISANLFGKKVSPHILPKDVRYAQTDPSARLRGHEPGV